MTYVLLDSGNFKKLEQFGDHVLERPAASAPWNPSNKSWNPHATFTRSKGGEGEWHLPRPQKKIPEKWIVENQNVKMGVRLTDFGHVGMFPEHHNLRESFQSKASQENPPKLLNLFAYTGFVSLVAAQEGWIVSHVDASKSSIAWAKDNAALNGLEKAPIFWYCDDVMKFVQKEIKRQKFYDAIVLDPPSYGRGPGGEIWKIEDDLVPLLQSLSQLMSPHFRFLQLSAHTPGLTPISLDNLLRTSFAPKTRGGSFESSEMCIEEQARKLQMPVGACASVRFF